MSFILDALKKSEKERQREAVPGISDLPIVIHQTRTSTWMVAVVTALGLGVIALVWAWWQTTDPGPIIASPAPETPAAIVPAPAIPPPAPALVEPQPARTKTRSLANEATRMAAAANRPPATSRDAESIVVQTTPAIITPSAMSILEARAAGMAVPDLTLELLVYSLEPAQRFVFINGSKYVEGDTLTDGPRVVEISTEGAVLSYRGQNFLLPQE